MTPIQRILKSLGESSFWRRAGRVHAALYRWTGGTVGGTSGGITNLLLTTTGRRSGERRTVPLAFLADGDRFVVVASNGGADRHPAWWINLRHAPAGEVQVGRRKVTVRAREATEQEWRVLWPRLTAVNPFFAQYAEITPRRIPVVVLEPASHLDRAQNRPLTGSFCAMVAAE